ncbi:insulinoma-associated protein 1 [Drosophila busckii]|uniref:insulinoma-associated protein 1 n=1 Tax=Drosophila busckii TaxID=30019 RepID=UPI001432B8E8|nr:insulinoma-associated protein 1 [Drosophila busckii]
MASVATNHSQAPTPTTQTTHTHSIQLLHNGSMPHGLGLLTTVASLPPKYRSRYLNIKTKCEIPLDLSVKPPSPVPSCEVPMPSTFTEVQSEPPAELELPQEVQVEVVEKAAILPPQSPTVGAAVKRKLSAQSVEQQQQQPAAKLVKSVANVASTPSKPIKVADTAPRTGKASTSTTSSSSSSSNAKATRNKATRKLKFDEETSSPVSGTIIRPLEDITDGNMQYSNGDIDPKYNIVEITEETKAELAAIKNVIGDYVCRLCRIKFDDAFGLARHRCACIVLLEYRCPECGKQFNCPANLASHRRWHKPKQQAQAAAASKKENRQQPQSQSQSQSSSSKKSAEELPFSCNDCGKQFKRAAYLRKHQQTHAKQTKTAAECEPEPEAEAKTESLQPSSTTITGSFQTTVYKSNSSSSSASSSHSYAGTHEDEGVYVVGAASSSHCDYEADYLSDCNSSTSSAGYGRLQIVEHGLTEEESIAAAALTNLRNCASVIQHTTMAH